MSDVSDMDVDEREAFLGDDYARSEESLPASPTRKRILGKKYQLSNPKAIVALLTFLKFAVVMSGMIIMMPVYRLIEDVFCHRHYEDDSPGLIEEMKCKTDDIQSELAFFIGWSGLLTAGITLLVAFPYGIIADRLGRKPTLMLSYFGLALSFSWTPVMLAFFQNQVRQNPYILILGIPLLLIGGGTQPFLSTMYAMASDVSTEHNRAANFLFVSTGASAGGLVGPMIAGTLMKLFGPWVPILFVLFATPFFFSLFIVIPETLDPALRSKTSNTDTLTVRQHIVKEYRNLFESFKIIKNVNILLILVTFLVQNAKVSAYIAILAQYISKHFGWKLEDISILLSPLGVLNILVLALLPLLSTFMTTRFKFTVFSKDLYLTRTSTILIIVGGVIQGFSQHVAFFLIGLLVSAFGVADSPLARATISHYVETQYTSRLFAVIGMVETAGAILGGPILAWLFHKGLQNKGLWIGLPWFYIAALHVVCWVCLRFVRPPKTQGIALPTDEEENPLRVD